MRFYYRNVYKITRSKTRQNEYGDLYNSREDADAGQATNRARLGVELVATVKRSWDIGAVVFFYLGKKS